MRGHVVRVVGFTSKRPIVEDVPLVTESNAIHGCSRIDMKWLSERPIKQTATANVETHPGIRYDVSILKVGGQRYFDVTDEKANTAVFYFSEY